MEDVQNAPVEQPIETPVAPKENVSDSVPVDKFRQLLDEKKKLRDKVNQYEQDEKKRKEEAMLQEGKLKEMLELREKEAEELRSRLNDAEQRDLIASKMSAVVKGLGSSVDDKWFSIIGQYVDEVVMGEDGNVDTASVSKLVESLKRTWPEMIKKPVVGVPSGGPTGSATISRSEWLKLPSSEMQKWKLHQIV